jgi:N-methylhydantoinase A/oxoprolinase/acetone carboxylase beta subunit
VYLSKSIDVPCYWFDDLRPGMHLEGPAMIDSESTTVVLPDRATAEIDAYGSLVITKTGGLS